MTKILVASFKDLKTANAAMQKLNDLEVLGDISIYEKVLVRKKVNDEFEILQNDSTDGWRTLTGMIIGGALGMLGGPIGFIIGVFGGGTIGTALEISHYDFDAGFITNLEKTMGTGSISIIAEIDEDNEIFVDTSLKSFDADIMRTTVDVEFDNYVTEQMEELQDDIAVARKDLKNSSEKDKETISRKIVELKSKRNEKIAELDVKAKKMSTTVAKGAAVAAVKLTTTVTEFANGIDNSLKEEKATIIRHRIERHENKVRHLKAALKEVEN